MCRQFSRGTAMLLVAALISLFETVSGQGCVGGDIDNAGEDNCTPTSFLPQSSSFGTGSFGSFYFGSSVCSSLGWFNVDMDVRSETIPCIVLNPDVMNTALALGSLVTFTNSFYGCTFSIPVTQPYVSGVTFNIGAKCHHGWSGTCYFGYLWANFQHP